MVAVIQAREPGRAKETDRPFARLKWFRGSQST